MAPSSTDNPTGTNRILIPAFYLAAPLYFIGSLFFVMEIGTFEFTFEPEETQNYIEGFIGAIASIIFIPVFLLGGNYISKK